MMVRIQQVHVIGICALSLQLVALVVWQSDLITTIRNKRKLTAITTFKFNHGTRREPTLIDKALARLAGIGRARLVHGILHNVNDTNPFDDVIVSLPFTPPLVARGYGDKTVLDPTVYSVSGDKSSCLVYGIGLYNETRFEIGMGNYCEVHAFDCTTAEDDPAVVNQGFNFHQVCIGSPTKITEGSTNIILHNPHPDQALVFKPYAQVMNELGHKRVDLLKFDIEGSEWELLEHILQYPVEYAPRQLVFEIHTEGASPRWVPTETVAGKNRVAVNKLFLRLHDFGYRVLYKQVNPGDKMCADFTLLLSR